MAADELQTIPGVGPSISRDLRLLGYDSIASLADQDPEAMYDRLCDISGYQDRCVLYVFRCAVYFASNQSHDPDLLKWWSWKDSKLQAQ
jgi:hypothetical protein